jgi:hypothetical protein
MTTGRVGTSAIEALWAGGLVPIRDALYLASGVSVGAKLDPGTARGVAFLEPFDLAAELSADPGLVTAVDTQHQVHLPGGGGTVCCGEAAQGADGFCARLGDDGRLRWLLLLTGANPFTDIRVQSGRLVRFRSTSGVELTVDLADPSQT